MSRKIVAIAGGGNGRKKEDGSNDPYELKEIDAEIVKLSGKEHPNFLFLAHSQSSEEGQEFYFNTMKNIYEKIFNCICKDIKSNELNNIEKAEKLIDWADIIYEGGGDTQSMIDLWQKTGFDKLLNKAWCNGKVMCGVSAGANCWFNCCNSDSLRIQMHDNTQPLIQVNCLNFIDAMFVPHCDEGDRYESAKEQLKKNEKVGLLLSNCSALEIIDNEYKLLTTIPSNGFHKINKAYGVKIFYDLRSNSYSETQIDSIGKFSSLEKLITGSQQFTIQKDTNI